MEKLLGKLGAKFVKNLQEVLKPLFTEKSSAELVRIPVVINKRNPFDRY